MLQGKGNTPQQAYDIANSVTPGMVIYRGASGRRRRDVSFKPSYESPYTVIDAGKVIVMPPLGVAPKDVPQFGQPGGGAPPETDPYTAAMAPEDTVPVAVFPPFSEYKKHPTKCVVFSELTDYEKNSEPAQPYRVRNSFFMTPALVFCFFCVFPVDFAKSTNSLFSLLFLFSLPLSASCTKSTKGLQLFMFTLYLSIWEPSYWSETVVCISSRERKKKVSISEVG